MMFFSFYVILSLLLLLFNIQNTTAQQDRGPFPLSNEEPVTNDPAYQKLYRFPNGTIVENLLVLRNNGSLLLTLSTEASLYRVDPKSYSTKTPVLVRRFPCRTSLLGIAQLNSSTIAVIAGNLTRSLYENNPGVPGSFSIFLLALSGRIVAEFSIPEASLLESLTALSDSSPYLLASDPTLSVVWRLNTRTGAVDKPFADPFFFTQGQKDSSLNGIHVFKKYLYFTNEHSGLLGRIPITSDGSRAGPTETRYYSFIYAGWDDFAIGPDGSLFITDPFFNTITQVGPQNAPYSLSVLVQDGIVQHPTAVAFAINSSSILYVVTAGYLPRLGGAGGGQVLRVDLDLLGSDFGGAGFVES